MVKLNIYNSYTHIDSQNHLSLFMELCTFAHVHFFKRRASQTDIISGKAKKLGKLITERKIKKYCYLDKMKNYYRIPTGILFNVLDVLDKRDISYEFIDNRKHPKKVWTSIDLNIELRDYQQEAISQAIELERGIIKHAPNAGKTYVSVVIANNIGVKALYIVPNKILLQQTYDIFSEYFGSDNIGIIGGGRMDTNIFTISTVQTLWSRIASPEVIHLLNNSGMIFFDEAHHLKFKSVKQRTQGAIPFNTWYQIAMQSDAYYRYGLTATPYPVGTLARGLLDSVTGQVIHEVSQSQLISDGYSVKPTITMIKYRVENSYNNWQESYKNLIYENVKFNKFIADIAKKYSALNKSVLIIVDKVQSQLELLIKFMPEAQYAYGKTSMKQRKNKMNEFDINRGSILIGTIFGEGVNLPSIDLLIIACGLKSPRLVEQRAGRAVRLQDGKDRVEVIDFMFEGDKYTHDHSLSRLKYYKSEEMFDVNVVEREEIL